MKKLLHNRTLYVVATLVIITGVILMMLGVGRQEQIELITTTVESGTVRQLVSVSGVAEAEQTAELAFPTTGIVSGVFAREGDQVQEGDVLISLEARALQADRADAVAALARAVATRDELLAGPQAETRAATAENVALKAATLDTIKATQADLIANARRTLLSGGLEAYSDDSNDDSVPPIITGTYACDEEGTYTMRMFSSGGSSGYSFTLSGLESGTYVASVDQPISFGDCGLRAQFDANSQYRNSVWLIDIPNKKSAVYVANRNAYVLTQTQADSAIAVAEQDLNLTQANADNANAPARSEAIARANADIASANARIARIDSQIADRTLVAPFAGTVTSIDILPGETVTTAPVVTLLAEADFEVTARIPEIDIGKLLVGQQVEMVFDAKSDEVLTGKIDFISLKATEIDGVAYYEALIRITDNPAWMRSGLNADIDVVIVETKESLRVPKRFVSENNGSYSVQTLTGETISTSTVNVILEGNDGFIAITGVTEGDVLVAP